MPAIEDWPLAGPAGADPRYRDRYIDLGSTFPQGSSYWSNDLQDVQLDMYFGIEKDATSVSNDFNMDLKPIIVKPDLSRGNTYLLTNVAGDFFFLWNEADGQMWRFKEGLPMNDVVYKVRTSTYSQSELVRQFYNPQGWYPKRG
ncbi:hypothetical protein B0T22DRAFT_485703 [Podospora appendiculata]|uniref:Uncharacterized protein n=1 Tax=Podospora appendiculata TaxID=314037 RepID=A0AAE0WZ85_9PEZI|nr:hypothetical protein B0T22DRAFT_485703 [Podospora appendiculata]